MSISLCRLIFLPNNGAGVNHSACFSRRCSPSNWSSKFLIDWTSSCCAVDRTLKFSCVSFGMKLFCTECDLDAAIVYKFLLLRMMIMIIFPAFFFYFEAWTNYFNCFFCDQRRYRNHIVPLTNISSNLWLGHFESKFFDLCDFLLKCSSTGTLMTLFRKMIIKMTIRCTKRFKIKLYFLFLYQNLSTKPNLKLYAKS